MTRARLSAPTMSSAYCRTEERRTAWSHSGYATTTGAENSIRPRAAYVSCKSCALTTLRLADVFDAFGLCLAVEKEWRRRALGRTVRADGEQAPGQASGVRYDIDNLIGLLFEHVWKLYTKWDPARLTFASYATGILRKKINTFVANDLGDAAGNRVNPKAHSRSVCGSYDQLTGWANEPHLGAGEDESRGYSPAGHDVHLGGERSLVFAYGRGAVDAAGGGTASGGWLGTVRGSGGAGRAIHGVSSTSGGVEATDARAGDHE